MAKRNALRELGKKPLPPHEFIDALSSLSHGSDRVAAIVGASLLESLLEKLIIKKLSHTAPDLITQLFTDRGPLSDFHSKILIAAAFGVITPTTAKEMHRLKAIRNVFAHAKVDVTFETPEIVEAMKGFVTLLDEVERTRHPSEFKFEQSCKSYFCRVTRALCEVVDAAYQLAGGERLIADEFPEGFPAELRSEYQGFRWQSFSMSARERDTENSDDKPDC